MDFLTEIRDRELLAQVVYEDELVDHIKSNQVAYTGFDPTAKSLHVGHLLPIVNLVRWQNCGHQAIILLGGGTGYIGDPTGKAKLRSFIDMNEINLNIKYISKQLNILINNNSNRKAIILNNYDWLSKLKYLDFLRDYGVHFSVNKMLTADCYKTRMETGLSFLEFNYMLLQSYDFWYLYKNHNCTIQLGGDDQWSNILGGVDLIRRIERGKAFCITTPLLLNSSGVKMGKTEKGTVWLSPDMTSPYDFFQYWRNIDDRDVILLLKKLTFLSEDQIRKMESLTGSELNKAKGVLAFEVTKFVHGEDEAKKSLDMTKSIFNSNASSKDAPIISFNRNDIKGEVHLLDVLKKGNICKSKKEARKLIEQGGIYVNDNRVDNINISYTLEDINSGIIIRKGKKKYYKIIVE